MARVQLQTARTHCACCAWPMGTSGFYQIWLQHKETSIFLHLWCRWGTIPNMKECYVSTQQKPLYILPRIGNQQTLKWTKLDFLQEKQGNKGNSKGGLTMKNTFMHEQIKPMILHVPPLRFAEIQENCSNEPGFGKPELTKIPIFCPSYCLAIFLKAYIVQCND